MTTRTLVSDDGVVAVYRVMNGGAVVGTDVEVSAASPLKVLLTNQADIEAKLTKALADIDALIGTQANAAGSNTLQAIKNQTKAAIAADPGPYIKALADSLLTVARALKRDIRLDLALLDSSD